MVKMSDHTTTCFDRIHERDTHTHTHTDTAWRHRPRLCIASRGKNYNYIIEFVKVMSKVLSVLVLFSLTRCSDTGRRSRQRCGCVCLWYRWTGDDVVYRVDTAYCWRAVAWWRNESGRERLHNCVADVAVSSTVQSATGQCTRCLASLSYLPHKCQSLEVYSRVWSSTSCR